MVQDQSLSITTVSWTLGSLCLVIIAVRLYTRALVTRQLGWDDFFIALSLVAVYYVLGMHTGNISNPGHRTQAAKYTVIAPNFSVVSTTTEKISVAIFLLRLMGRSATPWQCWYLYILTAVSIIWNVFAIIAIIGFCRPPKKIWLPETPGSCFSLNSQLVVGTSQAAFNAFADLSLAVFPVWIFRKVQLARYKKIGIIMILGAGIFAAAATMVKCILLRNLPEHADITWSWAPITTWYSIEMYVIIVCATLPTLPQAYAAILHKRLSYYDTSDYRSGKSEPKHPSSCLQRLPDVSLFESVAAKERGSSQENVLDKDGNDGMRIQKTTEVGVVQESKGSAEVEGHDPKYFPRQNPFGSSRGVPLSRN